MRTIRSALTSLGRSPVKLATTLATVGLGVAVLILAMSVSSAFARLISERLERGGLVVMIEITAGGKLAASTPAQLRRQVTATLLTELTGVAAASSVADVPFRSFVIGTKTYEIRNVLSVSDAYLEVLGIDVIAGTVFSGAKTRDALISTALAELLFGSPVAALGQPLQTATPGMEIRGNVDALSIDLFREIFTPLYTVRGVFEAPDELRRRAYGIGDMLVPVRDFTGSNRRSHQTKFGFVLRAVSGTFATVESQVRSALAAQFGEELAVDVWEGGPHHTSGVLEEIRSTARTFSLVVNLLGVLLLATGGVGLLSVMVVEVLSRSRQIALSRAFGATKAMIAREFLARSLIMMAASSALGMALSMVLSAPLTELVVPIFQDVTEMELTDLVITPAAVVLGVAASLGIGGLLGTLPVFSALATPIAEGIRD